MVKSYMIRRKFFQLFGAAFHIYDKAGTLIGYSKQKAFRLREDIRVYESEAMAFERLWIRTGNVIDFSASYDVVDKRGCVLGTWKRKGFTSLIRDKWLLFRDGVQIAELNEDSLGLALVRRLLCNLIPQSYQLTNGRQVLATYTQHFNPFIFKLDVSIAPDSGIDEDVLLAGGILLTAIERRQR